VEIEDVARVRLAARRAAEEQKYSAIVTPVYGARYCIGAGSDAFAAMTVVYSIAPNCFSLSTTRATVDCFWPMAT